MSSWFGRWAWMIAGVVSPLLVEAEHLDPCTGGVFDRIVGGCDATSVDLAGSFAYLICTDPDGDEYSRTCGGVLITKRHVLSAAHCDSEEITSVILNATYLPVEGAPQDDGLKIGVTKIVPHFLYTSNTKNMDFMLLELEEDVPDGFRPIPLVTTDYVNEFVDQKTLLVACGMGKEKSGAATTPEHIACVDIPYKESCGSYTKKEYNEKTMICAGEAGRDGCQGDSGGPLYHRMADGNWALVGITSWGKGCGSASYPGIWARVSATLDQTLYDWLRVHGATDFETVSEFSEFQPSGAEDVPSEPDETDETDEADEPDDEDLWSPDNPITEQEKSIIVDRHNVLRCLHWGKDGDLWAKNLTWSEELAEEVAGNSRKYIQPDWRTGRAKTGKAGSKKVYTGEPPDDWSLSDPGSTNFATLEGGGVQALEYAVEDLYSTGMWETKEGKGVTVTKGEKEFYTYVVRQPRKWKIMRTYLDMAWEGAGTIGCMKSAFGVEVVYTCIYGGRDEDSSKARHDTKVEDAWEGIDEKTQVTEVTDSETRATECGTELNRVVRAKLRMAFRAGGDALKDAAPKNLVHLSTVVLGCLALLAVERV